jgi:hypothetical protein
MARIRVGTASWTDPTLINSGRFYPPSVHSAQARLQFYASQFDLVEVDSSYYAMPNERNGYLWAEATEPPEGNAKAITSIAVIRNTPFISHILAFLNLVT